MNNTHTPSDQALNMARQSLYRAAALSLLDPRAGAWEQLEAIRHGPLLEGAAELIRQEPAARAETLAFGELPLEKLDPRGMLDRLPASRDGLNDHFEQTFGLLVTKACPPYETEYINSNFTFQRSQTLSDVSGFYCAFGLQVSDRAPERHDHIVQELEFMAFLLGLEREAEGSARATDQSRSPGECSAVCRDAQQRFLKEHLAWWAPTFCELLAREAPGGFYAAASEFLAALIPAERSLMHVAAAPQTAEPSPSERPEECEGCPLGAL